MVYKINDRTQQNDTAFLMSMVEVFYLASTYTKDKIKKDEYTEIANKLFDVLKPNYFETLDNLEANKKQNTYRREYRRRKKNETNN